MIVTVLGFILLFMSGVLLWELDKNWISMSWSLVGTHALLIVGGIIGGLLCLLYRGKG